MPFKYVHINTKNMTQKNGKSIYQVNLNHHPIKNAKRVAIVKASFPNSHNNVEQGMENSSLILKTFVKNGFNINIDENNDSFIVQGVNASNSIYNGDKRYKFSHGTYSITNFVAKFNTDGLTLQDPFGYEGSLAMSLQETTVNGVLQINLLLTYSNGHTSSASLTLKDTPFLTAIGFDPDTSLPNGTQITSQNTVGTAEEFETTHVIDIPDGTYTIEQVCNAINIRANQIMTSSTESLTATFDGNRVYLTYANTTPYSYSSTVNKYPSYTAQFYHSFGTNNKQNLLEELGFENDVTLIQPDSSISTVDGNGDPNIPPAAPSQNGDHFPTLENSPFYFIDSPELASQNIYTIDETTNNEVKTGNHLISLINNVPRYAYLSYEASSPIFHELHKDITHFSLEIKNHKQKTFSKISFFFCVLAFEYEEPFQYYEQQRREYSSQGYAMGHKI